MTAIVDFSPAPPCPEQFNLANYIFKAGQTTPDKIALRVYESGMPRSYSYAELTQAVLGAATGFHDAGIRGGDRVMMRIGSTVDFPVTFLALAAMDAIPMPTSIALSHSETLGLIKTTSPSAVIFDPASPLQGFSRIQIDVTQVRAFANYPPTTPIMGNSNRPGYIIFTSGTSGHPRAVLHAHRAVWARRMMWECWYDLRSSDIMMHTGALNWTYTFGTGILDPWAIGATAVIPNMQKPEGIWDIMRAEEATIFAATPGIYRRLIASPSAGNVPTLRHGLSAGDTLPEKLRTAWQTQTNTPLCEAFGMSECSTFLSAPPKAPETLTVQYGRKVAILDKDGIAKRDKAGFIAVSQNDPGLMLGYLHGKGLNLPLRGDWFQTEDQAVMYHDGSISFVGRSADIMNAGGYRVAPREIEKIFEGITGIQEVGVTEVEVKPDVWVIAAFVICDSHFNEFKLMDLAQQHLARYKHPRIVQQVSILPRNSNGKLIRAALPQLWKST